MSSVGVKIYEFSVPVCNSFEAIILNDQLCYQIDVNKYRTGDDDDEMKEGLTLLLDYNTDRHVLENVESSTKRRCFYIIWANPFTFSIKS